MTRSPAIDTARRLYDTALARLAEDGSVHPESACVLMALVMGFALFRKHRPGPAESGDEGRCQNVDHQVDAIIDADIPNILAALDKLARDGGVELEVLEVPPPLPPEHEPVEPAAAMLHRHGDALWQVLTESHLSPEDRLLATLFAVLFIVRQTSGLLSAPVAAALVLRGFAVGAKPPIL